MKQTASFPDRARFFWAFGSQPSRSNGRNGHVLPQDYVPTVSVVIPALNEAKNLPHVLPYIPTWVDEVLLVDGQSTDDTHEVARDLIARCPHRRAGRTGQRCCSPIGLQRPPRATSS